MRRAKVTAEHFAAHIAEPYVITINTLDPEEEAHEAMERTALKWAREGSPALPERRDPAHARLRELLVQKQALDNAIHAERLRLRR